MKKIYHNQNTNNSGIQTNASKNVNIAHFDAKGLLYLWFFSFLFLLLTILLGFSFLEYQILHLA